MKKRSRRLIRTPALALVAMLMLQGSAIAAEPAPTPTPRENRFEHAAAIGFDVVILRPLAVAAFVVGAALFGPVALMALPGGEERLREAQELFVIEPFQEAFQRPLGDF